MSPVGAPGDGPDAVLLLAFGGPEAMEDVRPFLENVLRGKPTPPERIEEVVAHYAAIGGRSPLRALTELQAEALRGLLAARGTPLPVAVGMRHWPPYIADSVRALCEAGARRIVAPILSAFDSPASKAAYEQVVRDTTAALGSQAPEVRVCAGLHAHPGFRAANADHVRAAVRSLGDVGRPRLVFTAHSIPEAAARRSPYVAQYRAAAAAVAEACGYGDAYTLAYQSRSGDPATAWLEPDVCDLLREHAAAGGGAVVLSPLGFVCDHVEVLYDLDVEARQTAESLGIALARARAAGDHPAFIETLADRVLEA